MNRLFWFVLSFFIVALGQSAWIGCLGFSAAALGYALFWRSMLQWKRPRERFWLSVFWFACVQGVQLSWMATTDYMGPLILVVYLFLICALGVQFGLLSFVLDKKQYLGLFNCASIAGMWVILEWIRLFFCTGFTWNPVGLALTTSLVSLQMASLFGIYGLSFWVIFVNLTALRWWMLQTRGSLSLWACCAFFPFAYGIMQTSLVSKDDRTMSVLLVQTALLPEQRDYDPKRPQAFISPLEQWHRMIALIERSKPYKPDLIVLPEGALPYDAFHCPYSYFDVQRIWMNVFGTSSQTELPSLGQPFIKPLSFLSQRGTYSLWKVSNAFWVQALANHYHCEVIVGLDDQDREKFKRYNAAFHFLPHRNIAARVEKRVLVPVGEYIPLEKWHLFARFLSNQFGVSDSFNPGEGAKIFLGRVPMGVSICYEETYSELIRQLRQKGAQMFVNISNDVWFPNSRLSWQHFDHGIVRAVENGVPHIRACNTGITGGVDCLGRVLAIQKEKEASALFLRVPLKTFSTLYSFLGDRAIVSLSCLFVFCFFYKNRWRNGIF